MFVWVWRCRRRSARVVVSVSAVAAGRYMRKCQGGAGRTCGWPPAVALALCFGDVRKWLVLTALRHAANGPAEGGLLCCVLRPFVPQKAVYGTPVVAACRPVGRLLSYLKAKYVPPLTAMRAE